MVPHKRTNRLVRKPLQIKLIAVFGAMACAATLVQIALLGQAFASLAGQLPAIRDQIYSALPGLLLRNLLWALGFLIPCVLLVGLRVTHRVAGPAYRIARHLDELRTQGASGATCRIRSHDHLQGLVKALNAAVERLTKHPERGDEFAPEAYSAPPPEFIRRRVKLIDKPLQLQMVGAFLSVGALAGLFQLAVMGNAMLTLSNDIGARAEPLMEFAPLYLARTLVITLILVMPASFGLGIHITHHVAGPAYRMRMYLEEVARRGAPDRPCKVRDKDELQDVCALLNDAIGALVEQEYKAGAEPETELDAMPSLLPEESSALSKSES